ncbi:hypothetical protein EPJ70_02060 [Brachyspira aalborgi]|uniref:Uncharacterized protein n=1 Tax=Brachyspira aalborgi TaxID=29522 RepID=A0A5C8F794_9SPIR|nr:hypothetical protein [Brachyspira aalborgi]TXJ46177.1 hypothetical protein EPJ70_02060 [Brachyspira aalborgi]
MTNKNILKILVIMIAVLSLFAVSCRKSGGGGGDPTPVNPTINAGGLLIISTNGATNINSINLSFANANGTLTEVSSEETTLQTLTTDNFIIENGTLKVSNFDFKNMPAGKSNAVTLTFKLTPSSATPITKDTETATIYIGKMQTNISVDTFKKSKFDVTDKNGNTKENQDNINGGDITSEPHENIFFQNSQFAVGTDDTTKFFLTNTQNGKAGNKLSVAEFTTILSNSIYKNTDIQTYNNNGGFEITSATNKDAPRIATWTIKFKPSVFYNEHSILLNMSADDNAADVGGWVD